MKKLLYIVFFISQLGHAMSLHEACREGNLDEVKIQLANDPSQLDEMKNGGLPIHCAAYACSPEIIRLLLDANPELVNKPDKRGNVPFNHVFMAISDWQMEVNKKERIGSIWKMVCVLQQPSPEEFEAFKAKKIQSFRDTIELLIERGVRLDKPNNFGYTWNEVSGIDQEWVTYARSIKLLQNK